ncbi:MAG: hypothetical protein ACHP7M_01550 [Burkholderiales bacterium]
MEQITEFFLRGLGFTERGSADAGSIGLTGPFERSLGRWMLEGDNRDRRRRATRSTYR